MAKKDELYVFFGNEEYKNGKSNILECQAEVLKIMKYLETLRRFNIEKRKLKIQMKKFFSDIKEDLEKLETHLPAPSIQKYIKEKSEEI